MNLMYKHPYKYTQSNEFIQNYELKKSKRSLEDIFLKVMIGSFGIILLALTVLIMLVLGAMFVDVWKMITR